MNTLLANFLITEDPLYFIFILVSIFIILLSSALLILLLVQTIKASQMRRNEMKGLKDEAYHEALQLLDDAQKKSLDILATSQIKARNSLDHAESLSKEAREELKDKVGKIYEKQTHTLENVGKEMLSAYKELLEVEKHTNLKNLEDTRNMIKDEMLSEVATFKESLKKDTFKVQEEIEKKVHEGYSEVSAEIEEYKRQKLEKLNTQIIEIMADIYTEVLGEKLTPDLHENFLLTRLEEELKRIS